MEKNDTKTAAPVKQDPLLVEVKKYLDARAAEDPQFAEKYAQEGKSLDECVRYIYGEAHKRAGHSKCVYIAPDEVFCMAVHYYDEKDIKVANLPAGVSAGMASGPSPRAQARQLSEEERKQLHAEAMAEFKEKEKEAIAKKAKEKAKQQREKERAEKRARIEAYRQQVAADGDLFGGMGL